MKVCLIPPDGLLHKKLDMDFVLAHRVIQSSKYRSHYPREDTYKILDNGAYERDRMDMYDILDMANEMSADEVILPDIIMQRLPRLFYQDLIPSLPKNYNYMVVPQGNDPLEYREAYNELKDLDGIHSLGIPIWLDKEFGSRLSVTMHMFRKGELNLALDHHLLGLDNYWELMCYPPGLIRSVDTSMPFSMAYSKESSTMYYDPPEHQRVPDDASIMDMDLGILNNEISMLREITRMV